METYQPDQALIDADGKKWVVQGIDEGEDGQQYYILTDEPRSSTSTRRVKVSEIGEYYAPASPGPPTQPA